jgi:hypothetical protein
MTEARAPKPGRRGLYKKRLAVVAGESFDGGYSGDGGN